MSFHCTICAFDYMEGAHPAIMKKLMETNLEKTVGYGQDPYTEDAKEKIRKACNAHLPCSHWRNINVILYFPFLSLCPFTALFAHLIFLFIASVLYRNAIHSVTLFFLSFLPSALLTFTDGVPLTIPTDFFPLS